MQIRCYHCHRPFALSKEAVYQALQEMTTNDMSHHNAYCPHCRRANRVSRKELLRAAPDWTPVEETADQGESVSDT